MKILLQKLFGIIIVLNFNFYILTSNAQISSLRRIREEGYLSILNSSPQRDFFITLYGSAEKAIGELRKEAERTNRSFEEIVNGSLSLDPSRLPQEKEHDFVIIGGGTGTNAMAKAFAKKGDITVGMLPTVYDDGGGTKRIIDRFKEKFGKWIFGAGDVVFMMLGSTHRYKNEVLKIRLPAEDKSRQTNLEAEMKTAIENVYTKAKQKAQELVKNGEYAREEDALRDVLPEDWNFFTANMLKLARVYDEKVLPFLDLYNAAFKNRIFLAQLIAGGYLNIEGDNLTIDHSKLNDALQGLNEILGIKHSYIFPASLDEATLYAEYSDGSKVYKQTVITENPPPDGAMMTKIGLAREGEGGFRDLAPNNPEWPAPADKAFELVDTAQKAIVVGPGSVGTSLIPNLLLKDKNGRSLAEALIERKDIPRIFILNPYFDYETMNMQPKDILKLIERSVQDALGSDIKVFGQDGIFNVVLLPTVSSLERNKYGLDQLREAGSIGKKRGDDLAKEMGVSYQELEDSNLLDRNGNLKGAKIPRGLMEVNDVLVQELREEGVTIGEIGEFEDIVETDVRIIEPDGTTRFVKVSTIKYDMDGIIDYILSQILP